MTKLYDVIIVGAGPVGLALGLGLAKAKLDVLILEKDKTTVKHSRAPAIWPGTQEILAELGVINTFIKKGTLLPTVELWDADREKVLLRVPVEELRGETQHPNLLILPQSETEKILYAELSKRAEVKFSCAVTKITQNKNGVSVRYNGKVARARFVVGCDGAHSIVRKEIGGKLRGATYKTQAALADVRFTTQLHNPRMTTKTHPAVGIRIEKNTWRMILPYEKNHIPLTKRVKEAAQDLFGKVTYKEIWKSEFKLHNRVSTKWQDRRVVLAGDAAHLNSPVGGEGMNAGFRDAAVLRNKLIEAVAHNTTKPLKEYVRIRKTGVTQGVNRFTNNMTRFILANNGRLLRPALRIAALMFKIKYLRMKVVRKLAMLE